MRIATLLTTTGLILLGTIAFADSVTYDFDRAANFSRFRTYTWVSGTNLQDELNHKRVVHAVQTQLSSKGLARVEGTAQADLLVAYHVSFSTDIQINASSSGFGPYGVGGSRFGSARTEEVLVGTLVLEMKDAATQSVVWRGLVSIDIDPKASPEKREKNANATAAKLLKHYPPKQK